jgi:hypothetical protein
LAAIRETVASFFFIGQGRPRPTTREGVPFPYAADSLKERKKELSFSSAATET